MTTVSPTPIRTEGSTARLRVARDGARTVATEIRGCAPLGLRVLGVRASALHVAVVQTAACLVGGDDVRLRVEVGEGARLVLTDISATLAHPVPRGRPGARQSIEGVVGDGASLEWIEQPLILAAGCRLVRDVELSMHGDARIVHHDTLVLGRHGETAGCARLRLRVTRDGLPVLDEGLDTARAAALASPAVLGGARVIASLGRYGEPVADVLPAGAMRLGPADLLVRRLATSTADVSDALAPEHVARVAEELLREGSELARRPF